MLSRNLIHKAGTAFLILMVFVTMLNVLAASRTSHAASGPIIAGTACHAGAPESGIPDKDDFKPPKHSFVDYDIFFSCSAFKPMNRPVTSISFQDTGNRALSGALSEILIPPKI